MISFPFPDRIESQEELKRDILYDKINPEDLGPIADLAWEKGVTAMKNLLDEQAGEDRDIARLCKKRGLTIVREDKDHVAGNMRFFSEYFSGKKQIVMYEKSIAKWASSNSMPLKAAWNLILSHELYHHLECTDLGLTSELYKVPWIRIGRFSLGHCGIRALSEIGAHGFSRTYYDACYGEKSTSQEEVPESRTKLKNQAMNEIHMRSAQGAGGLGIRKLLDPLRRRK